MRSSRPAPPTHLPTHPAGPAVFAASRTAAFLLFVLHALYLVKQPCTAAASRAATASAAGRAGDGSAASVTSGASWASPAGVGAAVRGVVDGGSRQLDTVSDPMRQQQDQQQQGTGRRERLRQSSTGAADVASGMGAEGAAATEHQGSSHAGPISGSGSRRSLAAGGAAGSGSGSGGQGAGDDDYGRDGGGSGGGDSDYEDDAGPAPAAAQVLPAAAPAVVQPGPVSVGPTSPAAAGAQQRGPGPQQGAPAAAAAAPALRPGDSGTTAGHAASGIGGGRAGRVGSAAAGSGPGGGVSWSSRYAGGDHRVPEGTVSRLGCDEPPRPLPRRLLEEWGCKEFHKICVDQQQFVSYDPRHYGPEAEPLPGFDVHDIRYNLPNPYGNGDKFKRGAGLHVAPVELRRAVPAEEACPDLQQPVFSVCTHPLVLWQKYMFNVGETFESTIVGMYEAVALGTNGTGSPSPSHTNNTHNSSTGASGASGDGGGGDGGGLDPALSLVVATPHGLRLPDYWQLLAGPFFQRQVVSLADFSARLHVRNQTAGGGGGEAEGAGGGAAAAPMRSNATAEGVHVRCFERLTMCRVLKRKRQHTTAAGAHLLRHYSAQLPAVSDLFDVGGTDADTLKVVIASRPNATGRAILNEQELLDACNGMDPGEAYRAGSSSGNSSSSGSRQLQPGARRVFGRLKCVAHVFGRNPMYDLSLSKSLDVLVATHGAAGYHSFYMSRGAAFVEVLPYGFSAKWTNVYYARMLELDKKVFYFAIYIRNASNSEDAEMQAWPTFRKAMRSRERHVRLPWAALKHHLTLVLQIGADADAYKAMYAAGRHVISEGLKLLPHRPKVNDSGWVNYTAGEAVRPGSLRLS